MGQKKKNALFRRLFSNQNLPDGTPENSTDPYSPLPSQSDNSSGSLRSHSSEIHHISSPTNVTRSSSSSSSNTTGFHTIGPDFSTPLSSVASPNERTQSRYSKPSASLKSKISNPTLIVSTQHATLERLQEISKLENVSEEQDSQAIIDSIASTLHNLSVEHQSQEQEKAQKRAQERLQARKLSTPSNDLSTISSSSSAKTSSSTTSPSHAITATTTISSTVAPVTSTDTDPSGSPHTLILNKTILDNDLTFDEPSFGSDEEEQVPVENESTSPEDMINELAQSLYDGTCRSVSHYNAASWIGDAGTERQLVRKAYMSLFNWTGLSVLAAIRDLCDRLYMKAESQQLDRIVDSFSDKWCECNPSHGFKFSSVIYTLAYSILLLNTDHHSEEYSASKKMPRSQYVQSTLEAMRTLALDGKEEMVPDPHMNLASLSTAKTPSTSKKRWTSSMTGGSSGSSAIDNTSLVDDSKFYPLKEWEFIVTGVLKSVYTSVDMTPLNLARFDQPNGEASRNPPPSYLNGTRPGSLFGSSDTWSDYEYSDAIANNGGNRRSGYPLDANGNPISSSASVYTTMGNGMPLPQDHNVGFAGALWSSIIREEQEKAQNTLVRDDSTIVTNEVTKSIEPKVVVENDVNEIRSHSPLATIEIREASTVEVNSIFSGSSALSESNDPTGLSYNTTTQNGYYGIGTGAIALGTSSTPSAKSTADRSSSVSKFNESQREEELSLHGAPWAKEGSVKFQAFFEKDSTPKKYKKKGWTEVFVVVQRGYLKMFQFDKHSSPTKKKSMLSALNKSKSNSSNTTKNSGSSTLSKTSGNTSIEGSFDSPLVGSGNWLDNATMIDSISLCHTMAHIIHIAPDGTDLLGVLPRSSSKMSKKTNLASHIGDNVQWALKLPNGGVLAFLAGTREIADEYVYTCNYWAARVSREPLVEAVSSNEFGWGKPLDVIFRARAGTTIKSSASSVSTTDSTRPSHSSRSKSTSSDAPLAVQTTNSSRGSGPQQNNSGGSTVVGKGLLRKKSSPGLSTSSKNTIMQARQNLLNSVYTGQITSNPVSPSISTATVPDSIATGSHHGSSSYNQDGKYSLLAIPRVSKTTTSAAAASASATAAATSLLGMNANSLTHTALHKDTAKLQTHFKTVTTKTAEGGLMLTNSHSNRKFYLASGSFDVMFINNMMISIKEWRPPVQSAVHSVLDETSQLAILEKYTTIVDETLEDHSSLRGKMMTVYHPTFLVTPRVTANWETKSKYLLSEAVKYDVYVSTLARAKQDREKMEAMTRR